MSIEYIKTNWTNSQEPAIDAEHLNNIENGIYNATTNINSIENKVDDIQNRIPDSSSLTESTTDYNLTLTFGDTTSTVIIPKTVYDSETSSLNLTTGTVVKKL